MCPTRTTVVGLISCMAIGGCASTVDVQPAERAPERVRLTADSSPPRELAAAPVTPVPTYVVQPRDTLYSIAWRHKLDYRELAKWNGIGADFKLSIGQVIVLEPARPVPQRPMPEHPTPERPSPHQSSPQVGKPVPLDQRPSVPVFVAPTPTQAPAPAPTPMPTLPSAAAGASSVTENEPPLEPTLPPPDGSKWVWPTERSSAPRPVPGGGILLLGHLGQDVRAAGAGRVVYTGSGIRGYGNLIIVKHGENLLSSYAHNQEVLVHEGDEVMMGQVIAHMGLGPHRVCALYFEIRVNGKPTDPLRYLSAAR